MKTRVTEHFDTKLGIYLYWVWKWDLWDAPDLRKAHPTEYDWRHVICLPDRERCITIAKQLAAPPDARQDIPMVKVGLWDQEKLVPLVAEFGEST